MKEVTLNDIIFIIVLYKVNLTDCITFNSLDRFKIQGNQKINLIIYDNSPDSQTHFNTDKVNVNTYYHDKDNPGVSKAYNYGANIAKKKGFKWIVLLDQDTVFPPDFIDSLLYTINCNPEIKLFAPVLKLKDGKPFSPSRYMFKRGHPVELKEGVLTLKKYAPVNSGMTINVDAYLEVGGYLEQITLDFADFQFIERFRKKYDNFYLFNSIAIQDFSNDETDLNKLQARFSIYCNCGINCKRDSFIDDIIYLYPLLRHTFGLYTKTKSLSFFKIFYLSYLKL